MNIQESLRVLGNRVMVELDEVVTTAGGLYMPQSVEMQFKKGKVVSVGEHYVVAGLKVYPQVGVGDAVLIDSIGALKVTVKGKDYHIVRNEDVVGIVGY